MALLGLCDISLLGQGRMRGGQGRQLPLLLGDDRAHRRECLAQGA